MFILKHEITGDMFGPYATKRHAIMYRPERDREQWKPFSTGTRSIEEAMAMGAAFNSAKVVK